MPSEEAKPTSTTAGLTHRLASLNPFSKDKNSTDPSGSSGGDDSDEEAGEELRGEGIGGGGKGTMDLPEDRKLLKVSHALRHYLADQGEIPQEEVDVAESGPALQELLARAPTIVTDEVNDRSHGLSSYFISSSHNSYLGTNQLTGTAKASRYTDILRAGCRCVEIDAWEEADVEDGLKVTHGYTLTQHITFRSAIEAIGSAMDEEIAHAKESGERMPLPIFISLENHCGADGQRRMAQVMTEVLGSKLVTEAVHDDGSELALSQLEGRVLIMVEYYGDESAKDAANDSEGESKKSSKEDNIKIVPELAKLGCYAQSIKPSNDSWLKGEMKEPAAALLNLGEGPLKDLAVKNPDGVINSNRNFLMRVYPAGTRVTSRNLNPVLCWGVGAHVGALNCQTYDYALQLQQALFEGTGGYALKPVWLRKDGHNAPKPTGTTRLTMKVIGATDLDLGKREVEDVKPYVTVSLYHPLNVEDKPEKRKTSHYHSHQKSRQLHTSHELPPNDSPFWHIPEDLAWEYPSHDLVFLRILVKSDDRFKTNPKLAVSSVRVDYLQKDKMLFLHLLNLKGEKTKGTLLVKFTEEKV